jgi:hypothetical protein
MLGAAWSAAAQSPPRTGICTGREGRMRASPYGPGSPQLATAESLTIGGFSDSAHVLLSTVAKSNQPADGRTGEE